MRKRYTKIICAAVAAISAFGLVFSSACSSYKRNAVDEKDIYAHDVYSNGGFLVQTGGEGGSNGFVYFINGEASSSADNTFGSVVKGSIQRIKKSDLEAGNYASTQTIVPSIIYSGQYNAGIYIYGNHIYYTTPSTQKDGVGNVLYDHLDFRRTTLDGSDTDKNYLWQSSDSAVDYRYVEENGTVYIMYAIAENLYGSSATNIHSVNCTTGENKLIAYNVSSYAFDTKDAENPAVYYTMSVPYFVGGSETYGYNQLYRATAGVSQAPREYDFSSIDDYDASKDPVYVNLGDYVLDGIGTTQNQTTGRVTQFNYGHWHPDNEYSLNNSEYTYSIDSYENGKLLFTRTSNIGSTTGSRYIIKDADITDENGNVKEGWDAVTANESVELFMYLGDSTPDYTFYELGGEIYAFNTGSSGITKGKLVNGKVEDVYTISGDSSATILEIREEQTSANVANTYMYYSVTGGNGYTFYRIAIDGESGNYNELPDEIVLDNTLTYRGVRILDLDACSGWYAPEFVGNTLVFCSETEGMSAFGYIMACNLGKDGFMMTNSQLKAYNEKYEEVTEKIEAYNDKKNTDGSDAYENLANALKYLKNTGDEGYLDELIQAYVKIEGKDKEYLYSEDSAKIYHEYAKATGAWADYKDDSKTVNGATVYANSRDYYYSVLGQMTEEDANGLKDYFKKEYMQTYPVDNSTWWEKLSTGAKVGFIIGMVAAGLVVLGGIAVLTIFIIKRVKKSKQERADDAKLKVDITDDKSVNVYDEEN